MSYISFSFVHRPHFYFPFQQLLFFCYFILYQTFFLYIFYDELR